MILFDVNIFVYAAREDSEHHAQYADWLTKTLASGEAIAVSEQILAGVIRILTNPRIFKVPTTFEEALGFVERIKNLPQVSIVAPGERHWPIFTRLSREIGAKGNLITDCYYAALAMEHDCEWITADGDFRRFSGLRWRHPF